MPEINLKTHGKAVARVTGSHPKIAFGFAVLLLASLCACTAEDKPAAPPAPIETIAPKADALVTDMPVSGVPDSSLPDPGLPDPGLPMVGPSPSPGPENPEAIVFNGKEYALDAAEIFASDFGDLAQLGRAVALTDLFLTLHSGTSPQWPDFPLPETLERLEINVQPGTAPIALDLTALNACPRLSGVTIVAEGPVSTLTLPSVPRCGVTLYQNCDRIDARGCDGRESLYLSGSHIVAEFGQGPRELTIDGASFDLTQLNGAAGLLRLSLSLPATDLSPLTGCPALKTLFLVDGGGANTRYDLPWEGWDLTQLACTSIQTLGLHQCWEFSLEDIQGLTSLQALYLDGEYTADIAPVLQAEKVTFLGITVPHEAAAEGGILNVSTITKENSDLLKKVACSIPMEQLQAFLSNGGSIVFYGRLGS